MIVLHSLRIGPHWPAHAPAPTLHGTSGLTVGESTLPSPAPSWWFDPSPVELPSPPEPSFVASPDLPESPARPSFADVLPSGFDPPVEDSTLPSPKVFVSPGTPLLAPHPTVKATSSPATHARNTKAPDDETTPVRAADEPADNPADHPVDDLMRSMIIRPPP